MLRHDKYQVLCSNQIIGYSKEADKHLIISQSLLQKQIKICEWGITRITEDTDMALLGHHLRLLPLSLATYGLQTCILLCHCPQQ